MLATKEIHYGRGQPPRSQGMSRFEVRLPAEPGSVPRARRALTEFANSHGADPAAVALAVSEAVSNAVLHGYRDGASGEVEVKAEVDGDELLVTIADDGVGMSPHPGSLGLGLGLPLIGQLSESVEIERPARGTTLLVRFPLAD